MSSSIAPSIEVLVARAGRGAQKAQRVVREFPGGRPEKARSRSVRRYPSYGPLDFNSQYSS